jgi:hypothetical protein
VDLSRVTFFALQRSLAEVYMDQASVSSLIRELIAAYRYELIPPDTTIGVAWSAEKAYVCVEKLTASLVLPYLHRFELRDTYHQVAGAKPSYAEYWVVAEGTGGYLEYYDPATSEFGLGVYRDGSAVPVSIGVRGDLVGVFAAM